MALRTKKNHDKHREAVKILIENVQEVRKPIFEPADKACCALINMTSEKPRNNMTDARMTYIIPIFFCGRRLQSILSTGMSTF